MTSDPDAGDAAPTRRRPVRVLGWVGFVGGLAMVATGLLLAIVGILRDTETLLLIGLGTLLLGFAVNVAGLVLLYRSVTAERLATLPPTRQDHPSDDRLP